jgi:hypothetical protein
MTLLMGLQCYGGIRNNAALVFSTRIPRTSDMNWQSCFNSNTVLIRPWFRILATVNLALLCFFCFIFMTSADVTTSTWSTAMTQYHYQGSFSIITTNSGTSAAEMQLTSTAYKSTVNAVYKSESPQSSTGGGFTLSLEIKAANAVADAIYVFIGQSSVPISEGPTGCGIGMLVAFTVYAKRPNGIYLLKTSLGASTTLMYYSGFAASGYWEPVVITYTPTSTNTWQVRFERLM